MMPSGNHQLAIRPAPVFQITEYYREGQFDSCLGKWRNLGDCMLLRTAAAPRIQAKLDAQEQREPPMWQMRTKEEAEAFWKAEFSSGGQ
eukprot:jgi/Mesen1/9047/ME000057S08462